MRGARKEGLPRRHRFQGHGRFQVALSRSGKFGGEFAVVHALARPEGISRFGISVGRRSARLAVQRNRIKRFAREVFRHHRIKESGMDVVVTLTRKFDVDELVAFARELGQLLDRAEGRSKR